MRRMAIGSFLVFLGLILLPYALSAQTIDWEQNHGGSDAERGYEVEAFP